MEDIRSPLVQKKSQLKEAIECLRQSPYYLWITLCIKFTSFAAFSVIAVCSSLYLTNIHHFSERETGLIFASFGLMIGIYSVCLSNLAKIWGIRNTMILGNIMGCIGYGLVLTTENRYLQFVFILIFLMCAISINLTNTKLGVKYYTYPKSRSLAYTLYYIVFFVAAGFASGGVDLLYSLYDEGPELYTIIFSFGLGLYITTLILSLFLREIDLENTDDVEVTFIMPSREVIKLKRFWKFVLFVSLMLIVKSVYFHLSGTLPLYMDRTIENGKHFGLMMVIHQIILLIATPICTYLVFYMDKYSIIILGSFFTTVSPLALYYENSYVGITLMVVVISLGESIYAPRLVDYTIEIAPQGAEAIFLGIAAITNSLPLIITGISSGFLMENYCTKDGSKDECHNVWVWVSGYSLVAVFVLLILRKHIEDKPYA